MPNTYDPSLPANMDKVRLLIGDTASPWTFDDRELEFFLSQQDSDLSLAAADALDAWATRMASRPVSYSRGGITVTRDAKQMRAMADNYRQRATAGFFEELTEFASDPFTLNRILYENAILD